MVWNFNLCSHWTTAREAYKLKNSYLFKEAKSLNICGIYVIYIWCKQ